LRDRFASVGEEITASERKTPQYLGNFIESELERWSGPIRAGGARRKSLTPVWVRIQRSLNNRASRLAVRSFAEYRAAALFLGKARVEIAAHEIGNGAYTVIGRITAERLGVPLRAVHVELGDSELPPGPIAISRKDSEITLKRPRARLDGSIRCSRN
jgi:hypothetical protein